MSRVRRWAGAAFLFLALALALPLRAQPVTSAELRTQVAGALVLHHPPDLARVAERLAVTGPAALSRISRDLGLPEPPHVDVWLLPRKSGVDPGALGLPGGPEWAAGLALQAEPVIVLRTAGDEGDGPEDVSRILAHELVHVVVSSGLGARRGAIPAWLNEGVASHLAYEWRLVDGASAIRLTLAGRWLDLGSLTASFPDDAAGAQLAYLESFSFVSWLVDEKPGVLGVLFPALARGENLPSAFREAFGESLSSAEERFRRSFTRRFRWIPIITSTGTLWALITALVLVSYLRKRQRSVNLLAVWEDEERLEPQPEPPPEDDEDPR